MLEKKVRYNVAVVGATGAVGRKMLEILEERNFPVANLKVLASARSAGQTLTYNGKFLDVEELKENSFVAVDIALLSAGGQVLKQSIALTVSKSWGNQSLSDCSRDSLKICSQRSNF